MLTVWCVPWSHIHINLPESIAQKTKYLKVYELKDVRQLFDQQDFSLLEPDVHAADVKHASSPRSIQNDGQQSGAKVLPDRSATHLGWMTWLLPMFWVLTSVGLITSEFFVYKKIIRQWKLKSKPANHLLDTTNIYGLDVQVRLLDAQEPGMATGIFKPIVWLSEKIKDPDIIKSVLMHELTHIKQHDVMWLWVLWLFKKIFWWNPIIWYLCYRCRCEIEFSCDESASRQLGSNIYLKSLARLILMESSPPMPVGQALAVVGQDGNDVQRLKWLKSDKRFSALHLSALTVFVLSGAVICGSYTYDLRFRDFFSVSDESFKVYRNESTVIEYNQSIQEYYEFMQLLYEKDLAAAGRVYSKIYNKVKNEPLDRKTLGFQTLAAYLGDTGQYQKILDVHEQLFGKNKDPIELSTPRYLATTLIILNRYDEAIDILEALEAQRYRGYANRLLLAQAYHLKGDFAKSIEHIQWTLKQPKLSFYNNHRITLIKLLGKNGILTDNQALVDQSRNMLGVSKTFDFGVLTFNHHRIPHIYFTHAAINGEALSGFDVEAFPLRQTLPTLKNPNLQKLFRLATRAANQNRYAEAKQTLNVALQLADSRKHIAQSDITDILEYLFIVNMRLGDKETLIRLSRRLVLLDDTSTDIKARAHWTLASGRYRYSKFGLKNFERYVELLDKSSLSLDHEKIERSYHRGKSEKIMDELERVIAYYEKQNLVPDIVILNRIIGHLENLGRQAQEQKYRAMLAKNYPKTLNFVLDQF